MKIGVRGSRFTLNGELRFLLGISYYGALGASEDFIIRDLYEMRRYGFNWLKGLGYMVSIWPRCLSCR